MIILIKMINISENIWSEAPCDDLLRLRRHMKPCQSSLRESGKRERRDLNTKHFWTSVGKGSGILATEAAAWRSNTDSRRTIPTKWRLCISSRAEEVLDEPDIYSIGVLNAFPLRGHSFYYCCVLKERRCGCCVCRRRQAAPYLYWNFQQWRRAGILLRPLCYRICARNEMMGMEPLAFHRGFYYTILVEKQAQTHRSSGRRC